MSLSLNIRTCICPVCGISVSQDIISQHVEQHFAAGEPTTSTNQPVSRSTGFQGTENHRLGTATTVDNWEESDVRICSYAGCQDIIFVSEWDDHMFAHMLEDQDDTELMSLATGQPLVSSSGIPHQHHSSGNCLDDSLLAQLTQQDLDSEFGLHDDWLLAQEVEKEQQRLREEEEFKKLQDQYGMSSNQGGYLKQYDRRLKQDVGRMKMSVGEYYARKADMFETLTSGHDAGESQTQGVISCLRASYSNGVSGIRAVYLCHETDHFASGVGDAGWGCGYRNTQMIISALLRSNVYHKLVTDGLDGTELPNIPKIQMMIENAWQKGFDPQGAEQLGGKLHNTSKWIGATEIAVLLRSLKIRARLVDFHQATGNDGTHPSMFTWIHQYYSNGNKHQEPQPPLFLQHQGTNCERCQRMSSAPCHGVINVPIKSSAKNYSPKNFTAGQRTTGHSRLCIGVEEHPRGECPIYLMLFDPSHAPRQMKALVQNVSTNIGAQLRLLRRSLKQMRSKQYQIVFIDGVMDSDQEYEASKELSSIRVP